jgi:hypothetical protein
MPIKTSSSLPGGIDAKVFEITSVARSPIGRSCPGGNMFMFTPGAAVTGPGPGPEGGRVGGGNPGAPPGPPRPNPNPPPGGPGGAPNCPCTGPGADAPAKPPGPPGSLPGGPGGTTGPPPAAPGGPAFLGPGSSVDNSTRRDRPLICTSLRLRTAERAVS